MSDRIGKDRFIAADPCAVDFRLFFPVSAARVAAVTAVQAFSDRSVICGDSVIIFSYFPFIGAGSSL